jgi:hypothetical protein
VPRGIEAFELDGLANPDQIAGLDPPVHAGDFSASLVVRDDLGPGGCHDGVIAAGVIPMLVGVEQLGDLPAPNLRPRQAFFMIDRVDGECLAGLGAGNQIIEITVGVASPDSLDEHGRISRCYGHAGGFDGAQSSGA